MINHLQKYKRSLSFYKLDKNYTNEYIEMFKWFQTMFKDLKEYKSYKFPKGTFYGTDIENIIIEEDLGIGANYIHQDKVYSAFKSHFTTINDDCGMYIIQDYLVKYLHLKGTFIYPIMSGYLDRTVPRALKNT